MAQANVLMKENLREEAIPHACVVIERSRLNVEFEENIDIDIEGFFKNKFNPSPTDLTVYGEEVLEDRRPHVLPYTPVLVCMGEITEADVGKFKYLDGHQVFRELPENSEIGLLTIMSMIRKDLFDPDKDGRQNVFFPRELPGVVMSYRKDDLLKEPDSTWHGVFFWKMENAVIDPDARVFYAARAPF